MSLFGTLQTGASGLGVSGASLGVIGDNIANLNTTGYKRNRASFADVLPQDVFGLGGPSQLGRGAARMTIGGQFTQGTLSGTGNALDVAITGQGWFELSNGPESFYTRDGSFGVDVDGYMVNGVGLRVQGYSAIGGQLSPTIGDVRISDAPAPPSETETITLDVVLDPNGVNAEDYSLLVLDGATVSIEDAANAADFSTSLTVYDSLGQPHEVVINFEKDPVNPDTWTYSLVIDGGEAGVGTDGLALEIGTGTMTFDTDGNLVSNTFAAAGPAWNWPGAAPWFPVLEFGLDAAGNPTDGSISQNANASAVVGVSQDGYAMGDLNSVAVDEDGVIRGQYTNGQELVLGQLAVATFEAESGLDRVGGNLFRATSVSGDAALGVAGTGGRGGIAGFALERSNVDIEAEFVDMIQAQRSYQANAGVIQTADETLQELVNLV